MRTVSELRVGEQGRVAGVVGSDEISQRLLEMGLTPGTPVRLLARRRWVIRWNLSCAGID